MCDPTKVRPIFYFRGNTLLNPLSKTADSKKPGPEFKLLAKMTKK